jgi:hypothetical protein
VCCPGQGRGNLKGGANVLDYGEKLFSFTWSGRKITIAYPFFSLLIIFYQESSYVLFL